MVTGASLSINKHLCLSVVKTRNCLPWEAILVRKLKRVTKQSIKHQKKGQQQ